MKDEIIVYVKCDKNNLIVDIRSNIFLIDVQDYIEIDRWKEGEERYIYAHADNGEYIKNKHGLAIRDESGKPNYKYIDAKIQKLTEEEKEQLYPVVQEEGLTDKERISLLEQAMQDLILIMNS